MSLTKSNIPVSWGNECSLFSWNETVMTDEAPKDDLWDIPATQNRLRLEQLYKDLNISAECTKHYMCFRPELSEGLTAVLDNFKNVNYNYNFLKLEAGHNIIKHYDSYSTFVKFNNIPEHRYEDINRTIIMMTDWSFGQILQVEDIVESHWKKGDTYTWKGSAWHGLGNFGLDECVVMQVTWIENE